MAYAPIRFILEFQYFRAFFATGISYEFRLIFTLVGSLSYYSNNKEDGLMGQGQ